MTLAQSGAVEVRILVAVLGTPVEQNSVVVEHNLAEVEMHTAALEVQIPAALETRSLVALDTLAVGHMIEGPHSVNIEELCTERT